MSIEGPQELEQEKPTGEELYKSHMTCKRTMRKNTLGSVCVNGLIQLVTWTMLVWTVDGNIVLVSIANVPTQNLS